MMCGGTSEQKAATQEIQAICDEVRLCGEVLSSPFLLLSFWFSFCILVLRLNKKVSERVCSQRGFMLSAWLSV